MPWNQTKSSDDPLKDWREYELGKQGVIRGTLSNQAGLAERQRETQKKRAGRQGAARFVSTRDLVASASTSRTPQEDTEPWLASIFPSIHRVLGFDTPEKRRKRLLASALLGAVSGLGYGLSIGASSAGVAGYGLAGAFGGLLFFPLLIVCIKLVLLAVILGLVGLLFYAAYWIWSAS